MDKRKKQAAGVAAGLAALAATAAGMYYFGGKRGAKNRQKVAGWVDDAKNEVIKQLENTEKVTKANYNKVVDAMTKQYKDLKDIDKSELLALSKELKGHWDSISREISQAAEQVKGAKLSGSKKNDNGAKQSIKQTTKRATPKAKTNNKKTK